ncbi:MAG: beta-galactosidase [Anaerolineae bacterium]|nr:beta-galactosidase [Anaerolineae bacterium]
MNTHTTERLLADPCPVRIEQDRVKPDKSHSSSMRTAAVLSLALIVSVSSADPIHQDAFGMHFHVMANGGDWPSTAEFGYLRLWDAGVRWQNLEPEKGKWEFQLLDRYVDEAAKRGVKILLTLGQTPRWAARRPNAPSPYGPGGSSEPQSLGDWGTYVTTLVTRYKGRIDAWELWNEVNVNHFWSGDFARLVEMERVMAETVKRVDPEAVTLSASVQGGAFGRLDAYFAAGGGRHVDAISYHFYAPTEEPEALVERIHRVREIMAKHGLGAKPLWNTEFGWLIPNSDGGYGNQSRPAWTSWRRVGYREAAGYVVRAYLHILNGGIRHSFWYSWDNQAMGLAENRGSTPKPAAVGFKRVQEWLIGASLEGCDVSSGIWICTLRREDRRQWVVWSDSRRSFTPPAAWNVRTAQAIYDEQPREPESIVYLSALPTLFSQ